MVFIIPSQTLFQERTPPELMGRVVGFRFALVFGSMTIAMALGSVLAEVFGPGPVIAVFGLVTAVAGLAGLCSSRRCAMPDGRGPSGFGTLAPAPRPMIEPAARRTGAP